jgi:type I restriction enzyme S subunit
MRNLAFINQDYENLLLGSDCIRLRVHNTSLLPKYLFYFLSSEVTQQWLQGQAYGTVMPGINEKLLAKMLIPIPNLHIQKEITDNFDRIVTASSQFEGKCSIHYNTKRAILDKLIQVGV